MKIWGDIPKIPGVYDKQRNFNKVAATYGVSSKKDIVSISSQAKDYQSVMKVLKDMPDVRQDKVDELSQKYESGSYDVSGKDIVDRVLKSVIDKKA